MAAEIEIRGSGFTVLVVVVAREYTGAVDPDDFTWLNCRLEITTPFAAMKMPLSMQVSDLERFHDQLVVSQSTLSSSAELQSREHGLFLEVQYDALGTAEVRGQAHISAEGETTLSFSLPTDQTYLASTLMQLKAALDLIGE